MSSKIKLFLAGVCGFAALAACQSNHSASCPMGFVETNNIGMGDAVICCPFGTVGQDGYCVDESQNFAPTPTNDIVEANSVVADGFIPLEEPIQQTQPEVAEKSIEEPVEEKIVVEEKEEAPTVDTDAFAYLTAPNGKGSAYCPKKANSLAWNGVQYKCCGYGLNATEIPSREDSICCPVGSVSARWIGEKDLTMNAVQKELSKLKTKVSEINTFVVQNTKSVRMVFASRKQN